LFLIVQQRVPGDLMIYGFGNLSLDPSCRELRRNGGLVAVEPQTFDLLLYLIENRHRVVSKDDLMAAIWKNRIVSESTLSSQIAVARQAVGDNGASQMLIRTLPRKGFRFVGKLFEREQAIQVEELPARPKPSEEPSINLPRPERRQISMLICDLINTHASGARQDPEDFIENVSQYHDQIKQVVGAYGGFVSKVSGDEILVYFGYPRASEDDAERAVRAGLAVIDSVSQLNLRRNNQLQARVAVATGLVVVGDLKIAGISNDDTAVGDLLPLAKQLLTHAQSSTVVISAATRRLIGELFFYRDLGAINSKSGPHPVEIWQVTGESKIPSRFEALRSRHTKLIGRDEEIQILQRRWTQVQDGEGRVVLIYGEPGIGKSRLVLALQEAIADEQHRCLQFYCSPHRGQTALYPVINQIEYAAKLQPTDSDPIKIEKLKSLLSLSSQNVEGDAALLADLLSVSVDDSLSRLSLSPQRRKELILERFIAQLRGLAEKTPVLMVLEDAHWIDPTTRELFDIIAEQIRTLPVLLIVTYRPEFRPSWVGQSHVTVLTLNRLDRRANVAMIQQVTGGREIPPDLLEQIVTRTDGIPLFIEEMTKSVIESEALHEKDGSFVLADSLPSIAVPATLQASLVARLDRLAPLREIVQAAATLGRDFSYFLLRAVCNLDDAKLEPLLNQLVESELVYQRGSIPHAVYTFKHALVQDTAYGTMLKSQRVQMHARTVHVLEHEFFELSERNPDVLAYHCAEASMLDKAVDYWLKAARMAIDRSAGVESRAQVEKAMALLPKVADQAISQQFEGRIQVALADTLVMTKGFASPEVATALSKARTLLDPSAYPIETLRALGGLCQYHLIRSEAPKSLALVEPLLLKPSNDLSQMVFHFLVGTADLHIGNFESAESHLEKALSRYDESACRPIAFIAGVHVHSFSLVWLALTYMYLGKLKQANDTMVAAITDARNRLHPFTLVSALLASARFHHHINDLQSAIAMTDEGLAIATEQRSPYHISRANILHAVNVVTSGRPTEGIELMDRALVEHHKTGANFQSSFNLSCLAEAYARAGRFARAIEFADQAINEVEISGERWWAAEAQRVKGKILQAGSSADRRDIECCFKAALEIAHGQRAKFWELRATCDLARLWSVEGRKSAAKKLISKIYDEFSDEDADVPDLKEAKRLMNKLGLHA